MASKPVATAFLAVAFSASFWAQAGGQETEGAPLSAIDWLSESVRGQQPVIALPPTGTGAPIEAITVAPLDAPSVDAVGLLPASRAGLPKDFWGATPAATLAARLRAARVESLPAVQALLRTMLIAELAPPADADSAGHGALLLARIDKLMEFGALDQAMALLDAAGAESPELFRRWFDAALLLGEEDRACIALQRLPDMAPTYPVRVYCLARSGDWSAAALTLRSAEALGYIGEEDALLLAYFLDPEFEGPELSMPARPSPLVWRMLEAIGEPVPTQGLPLAYAHADLRGTAGWRAQVEAAERLTRMGAITPNRLLGLYTERMPAASGSVWDRVAAMQRFDTAIAAGDPSAVTTALLLVWPHVEAMELEVAFARLYGAELLRLPLTDFAATLAFRIGLLTDEYETVAAEHAPANAQEAFLAGVARGALAGLTPPDALGEAVASAFSDPAPVPEELGVMLGEDRLGEMVLAALERVTDGAAGDLRGVAEGLAALRAVGLEDTARRAALQLMLLERRG